MRSFTAGSCLSSEAWSPTSITSSTRAFLTRCHHENSGAMCLENEQTVYIFSQLKKPKTTGIRFDSTGRDVYQLLKVVFAATATTMDGKWYNNNIVQMTCAIVAKHFIWLFDEHGDTTGGEPCMQYNFVVSPCHLVIVGASPRRHCCQWVRRKTHTHTHSHPHSTFLRRQRLNGAIPQ